MIALCTCEGTRYEVDRRTAEVSGVLRRMLEDVDDGCEAPIPLMRINDKVMGPVLQYCKRAANSSAGEHPSIPLPEDKDGLIELVLATNYLDIPDLLDACCEAIAQKLEGKGPDQIRKEFDIENKFTPEEEAKVRAENMWAFD